MLDETVNLNFAFNVKTRMVQIEDLNNSCKIKYNIPIFRVAQNCLGLKIIGLKNKF